MEPDERGTEGTDGAAVYRNVRQADGLARSNLDNESLAEEAVQETFRIACQKYGKLFDSPNPHGWLVLTLRHTIQNMKKQCLNDKVLLSQYLAVQARNISFSEDMLSLDVQYGKIADTEEFKIIKEMAVDGYSHLELAQARGITVNACKKRVQRSKELLQKKLKK